MTSEPSACPHGDEPAETSTLGPPPLEQRVEATKTPYPSEKGLLPRGSWDQVTLKPEGAWGSQTPHFTREKPREVT